MEKWVTSTVFVVVRTQGVAEVRVTNLEDRYVVRKDPCRQQGSIKVVQKGGQDSSERLNKYSLYQISKMLQVEVVINGQPLSMELDTVAAVMVVSEETFQSK